MIGRRLAATRPATRAQLQPLVVPYTDIFAEGEGESDPLELVIIQIILTLLLVVVCLNVAVLVYARTVTRTAEIAVLAAEFAAPRAFVHFVVSRAPTWCVE